MITAALIAALAINIGGEAYADNIPSISAESAIVVNENGDAVYEKNADARMLIASTTKLMTALVTAENSFAEDTVEIKKEYCGIEGSSMYLKAGERYTVRELLYGLMLVSGNDAAEALACHTAGSTDAFVQLMNERARELGMNETVFKNPHGLDAEGHYSTARDMAKLMLACMDNETVKSIAGSKTALIGTQTLANHNRLLWRYKYCTAGKTGYTMAAGRCLVSCAERDGMRFVCVTLSAADDWNDQTRLYDWAFENFEMKNPVKGISFRVPVVSGSKDYAELVPAEEIRLFLRKDKQPQLSAEVPPFVFAPVNLGETGGKLCVIIDSKKVAECRLVYSESVKPAQKTAAYGKSGE